MKTLSGNPNPYGFRLHQAPTYPFPYGSRGGVGARYPLPYGSRRQWVITVPYRARDCGPHIFPPSSTLIHPRPPSSTLIHPHPPSSTLIHPHPLSSTLARVHPCPSSSTLCPPLPHLNCFVSCMFLVQVRTVTLFFSPSFFFVYQPEECFFSVSPLPGEKTLFGEIERAPLVLEKERKKGGSLRQKEALPLLPLPSRKKKSRGEGRTFGEEKGGDSSLGEPSLPLPAEPLTPGARGGRPLPPFFSFLPPPEEKRGRREGKERREKGGS